MIANPKEHFIQGSAFLPDGDGLNENGTEMSTMDHGLRKCLTPTDITRYELHILDKGPIFNGRRHNLQRLGHTQTTSVQGRQQVTKPGVDHLHFEIAKDGEFEF